MTEVRESYQRLRGQCDIVIVEGAGSPAEINLRQGDIANMGFARAADVPVVLIGDMDCGGVMASIVGTRAGIEPEEAEMRSEEHTSELKTLMRIKYAIFRLSKQQQLKCFIMFVLIVLLKVLLL